MLPAKLFRFRKPGDWVSVGEGFLDFDFKLFSLTLYSHAFRDGLAGIYPAGIRSIRSNPDRIIFEKKLGELESVARDDSDAILHFSMDDGVYALSFVKEEDLSTILSFIKVHSLSGASMEDLDELKGARAIIEDFDDTDKNLFTRCIRESGETNFISKLLDGYRNGGAAVRDEISKIVMALAKFDVQEHSELYEILFSPRNVTTSSEAMLHFLGIDPGQVTPMKDVEIPQFMKERYNEDELEIIRYIKFLDELKLYIGRNIDTENVVTFFDFAIKTNVWNLFFEEDKDKDPPEFELWYQSADEEGKKNIEKLFVEVISLLNQMNYFESVPTEAIQSRLFIFQKMLGIRSTRFQALDGLTNLFSLLSVSQMRDLMIENPAILTHTIRAALDDSDIRISRAGFFFLSMVSGFGDDLADAEEGGGDDDERLKKILKILFVDNRRLFMSAVSYERYLLDIPLYFGGLVDFFTNYCKSQSDFPYHVEEVIPLMLCVKVMQNKAGLQKRIEHKMTRMIAYAHPLYDSKTRWMVFGVVLDRFLGRNDKDILWNTQLFALERMLIGADTSVLGKLARDRDKITKMDANTHLRAILKKVRFMRRKKKRRGSSREYRQV